MIGTLTLVLLWFKKKNPQKTFFLVFDTLDLCRVCLHMKACCPVVLVKILSEFWNWVPHFFSQYDCLFYCTMYDSCPYILHDRLWCGFILCLTCTWKQNVFIPSTSSVFHFHLFGKRIRAITKTSWRSSDGYGFKFPLFRVILYLYERPVLNGLWIWGGKISGNFTTSLFSDFYEFVIHLLSDAWLYLLLRNSLHLKKGVFRLSAWN